MNKRLTIASLALFLFSTSFRIPEGWQPLLDTGLSKWRTYLSYRHKDGYRGEVPKDQHGKAIPPVGYDRNEANVFSVIKQGASPVLRISGEIYGCIFTKQDFSNYHLKLKVRWGTKKWEPRLREPMDSGILYHSRGECGVDYFRSWMLSHEFQIIERSMGDYWCIGTSRVSVKASGIAGTDSLIYDKEGTAHTLGTGDSKGYYFCKAGTDNEKKEGQWNEIELICFNGKSLHIVNGRVVMALSALSYRDGSEIKPLTRGKIQLQSEAAEVFYKDILIRKIDQIPAEYQEYLE